MNGKQWLVLGAVLACCVLIAWWAGLIHGVLFACGVRVGQIISDWQYTQQKSQSL